ncbi:unnamed protein product [Arctogadus glacialis]
MNRSGNDMSLNRNRGVADEKNQVMITNAWLQLHWTDVYLVWNPENYPGVQTIRFPSSQVWVPDILLYNSADERFDATFHTNVLVNSSGACQYIPPGILKSTCYIDVRWFPFDVQKCDLKFGSWTHNGWLLDLQMMDVDISTYIPNGEWDLVGVPAKRNELYYDCCKEPYPDVTFTVTMRRRTLYYGLNLLIPCVLISGLALLVFLLPADSGEKISLGISQTRVLLDHKSLNGTGHQVRSDQKSTVIQIINWVWTKVTSSRGGLDQVIIMAGFLKWDWTGRPSWLGTVLYDADRRQVQLNISLQARALRDSSPAPPVT